MIIDGKVYRNLEGQVAYLTEYLNANAVASELGIKVIGTEEDVSDIPAGEYQYGDAYMIGTEVPYTLYIWTRANGNHPEDFWFNVGQFPMPGPQGETGIGVDDVTGATINNWTDITAIYNQQTDITTVYAQGTNTETLSDNSTVEIPTNVEIPFHTDGQVSVGTYEDVDNNRAISISLTKDLDSTYVAQRPGISADYDGVSYVYGGYKSGTTKLNNVQVLPIRFDKNNVVMNIQTGYDADKNTYSTIYSRWNTILGKANQLQGTSSAANANTENLVFGGKNLLANGVQDSATFGYRNTVYANQAFTAGYKNTNKGSESIVIGNQNTLNGLITVDTTPDPDTGGYDGASSNTKQMAVFGNKINVGYNNQTSLIAGDQNTIGSSSKWNFVVGAQQNMGSHNVCVNAMDYGNVTGDYVEDSAMIGYYNHIYGGSSGSVKYGVYMIGHDNDNRDRNDNAVSEVICIGRGLHAGKSGQVVIGSYNAGDLSDNTSLFVIGTGSAADARHTTFRVSAGSTGVRGTLSILNNGDNPATLYIGSTSINEAQLQSLLALI